MQTDTPTEAKQCPHCHSSLDPDARYCGTCGASVVPPPECPACGADVLAEAHFCMKCGFALVGPRPEADSPEPSAATAPTLDQDSQILQAEAAALPARKVSNNSTILPNVILFFALLVAILVVIKEMNQGKPKEMSPFEGGPTSSMTPSSSGTGSSAQVVGQIQVSPELAAKAQGKGTLFIILRMKGMPDMGPPIAVKRVASPTFPLSFSVGSQNLMQQGTPFEGPFDVRARLDFDGNAMTKNPGDLFTSVPVAADPGKTSVTVVLDKSL